MLRLKWLLNVETYFTTFTPIKILLWGAFGYCLLTDAWQGATAALLQAISS